MENNSFSKVDGENHANEIFMDLFDAVVVVILLIALFRGPVVHNELKLGKKSILEEKCTVCLKV